jgi:hypothetical protein
VWRPLSPPSCNSCGQAANSQLPWRGLAVIYIYTYIVIERLRFVSSNKRILIRHVTSLVDLPPMTHILLTFNVEQIHK